MWRGCPSFELSGAGRVFSPPPNAILQIDGRFPPGFQSWRRGASSRRFAEKGLVSRAWRVPVSGARDYVRDASKTLKTAGVGTPSGDKMSAPGSADAQPRGKKNYEN